MILGRSSRTAGVGEKETTDGQRRIANVLRFGTVKEADYARGRLRIVMGDEGDPEGHVNTAWLPWLTGRAGGDRTWWAPEVGEAVIVLSPGGELTNGVVLPGVFSDAAPGPADRATVHRTIYADGAVIEYDREAHRLKAVIPGDVVVDAERDVTATIGRNVTVAAAGKIEITAALTITIAAAAPVLVTSATLITLAAPTIAVMAASGGGSTDAVLTGDFRLRGNLTIEEGHLEVGGNVHATGTIIDDAGNTGHHSGHW